MREGCSASVAKWRRASGGTIDNLDLTTSGYVVVVGTKLCRLIRQDRLERDGSRLRRR